uniref:Uncharacterized protein n=1 Tax=Dulem virus 32 TaxID=3145750 RepID=A0AAU8B1Q3_9CAUD
MAYEVLTTLGVRLQDLGSDQLTWQDLAILLAHPRRGGPLHAAIYGSDAVWDDQSNQLLGLIFDRLGAISWQLGGDADAEQPTPISPGARQEPDLDGPIDDDDAYTMDELAALYDGR